MLIPKGAPCKVSRSPQQPDPAGDVAVRRHVTVTVTSAKAYSSAAAGTGPFVSPPRFAAAALLLTLAMEAALAAEGFPFHRAVYRPWNFDVHGSWNFSEMGSLGLDAFYAHGDWTWEIYSPGWTEDRFGSESILAAANNVTYIAGQYYLQPMWQYIDFNYSRAVDQYGREETYTPAPLDEAWWRHMMEEAGVFIANLSLHYPICGLVWDMEPYYSQGFQPAHYSYDESSLGAFASATNRTLPSLAPAQRHGWLQANGLLEEYKSWCDMKAYLLARGLAEKVHAVNPKLQLGILGFVDCWFYWNMLKGFNSSAAPVSAWYEGTYRAYVSSGPEGVSRYLDLWRSNQLNGQFIPGIGMISPWAALTSMEASTRETGGFWFYQRDGQPPPEYDDALRAVYGAVDRYIFFSGSEADPLPAFDLQPGVEARPYLGPGGRVSILLSEREYGVDPPASFTITSSRGQVGYFGQNLTPTIRHSSELTLGPQDFPCIVFGLDRADLELIRARALLREMEGLLSAHQRAGLGDIAFAREALAIATGHFEAGRYGEVVSGLTQARNRTYQAILTEVWPLVEAGTASPRTSVMPLALLSRFSLARRLISEGKEASGEMYLYWGLRDWSLSVPEPWIFALPLLALLSVPKAQDRLVRSRRRATQHPAKP